MNIHQAARSYRAAQQQYEVAFRDYFAHEVTSLPDDRFWQLQAIFGREVIAFRFGYGRTNGIEQAARELFRKPLAGDFSCRGEGGRSCPLLTARSNPVRQELAGTHRPALPAAVRCGRKPQR